MKKQIYTLLTRLTMMVVLAVIASGCSSSDIKGDPDVEKQLEGTWRTTFTETEYEDGERIVTEVEETVTYDAQNHTLKTTYEAWVTSPMKIHIATIKCTGTWKADKGTLVEKYDESSYKFKFGLMLDQADRDELRDEVLAESENLCEIVSLSEDSFTINDGEDETTYYRQ